MSRTGERYVPPDIQRGRAPSYSGREHERSLFGTMDTTSQQYKTAFEKVADSKGYAPFNESMDLVEKFQTGDPRDPKKFFLKDIFLELQDQLEEAGFEVEDILAFTSLYTPLDFKHGVDAYIKVKIDGKWYLVTMDASLNRKKETPKALLLIRDLPEPFEGEKEQDEYLEVIKNHTETAVEHLKKEIETDMEDKRNHSVHRRL